MIQSILKDKPTRLFLILGGFFIANAMIAEFIGVKIFSLEDTLGVPRANINLFGSPFSFHLTAGVLLWPVVFIMTDIINEYFGSKGVRFLSYLTVGLISYSFMMFSGAINLKPSEYFTIGNGIGNADSAYRGIFGQGLWIIIGSIVAFLIGQLLDVFVFQRIKRVTGEKNIWLRATGSTLVSQLVDSFVVLFIAFYLGRRLEGGQGEPWTLHQIAVTGTGNYIYKFAMAVLLTPVIYLLHGWIERYLGHDLAARMKRGAMQQQEEPVTNIPTAG
ncbi:MAG TPA: queuosine precursor transporter [Flavisolibacter sp.]|nr:queuosine precursor transporter [Flavisolibacter sp.]